MAYRRFTPLLLSSLLIAATAGAAELGEPRISSYKGQPLVADIELSGLDDPAAAVQVRVANPDVYRGASMTVPPLLSALSLNVVRQGGKQFVHVTSNRPVDTDMLLLFLELGQGGQRDVRLATLWLTADPRPPAPAPVSGPAPAPATLAASAATAAAVAPASVVTAGPAPAPVAARPAPLHLADVSTALPPSVRSRPAATCKVAAADNTCAVLDTKNVALQAKLVGLEDTIKKLQAALAPAHAASASVPASVSAPLVAPPAAVKPPPEPVAVLVKPKKPRPAAPAPSPTPWLWIGVAATVALAALGAIVFLLLRRRGKELPSPPAAPGPGFMAGIRQRFARNKAAPAAPPAMEA